MKYIPNTYGGTICDGVVVDMGAHKMVYVSGLVGSDADGKVTAPTIEAEAELCFANLRRVMTEAGGTMADIDLLIEQPTLDERASVQVKSRAGQAVLDEHIALFAASGLGRTFFVCHSPDGALTTRGAFGVHLWTNTHLAEIAVRSGLFEWLMERVG